MPKLGLFIPPRLRSGQEAEVERHASWLELFYDLVFVAAVAQLATSLGSDYSLGGILCFSGLFVPVWWAWVGHTFYLTRFDTEDVGHRLLTFALWWGYFERAKGAAVRTLSAKKHVRRYQLWLYSHLPLLMGITATSVGVKHVLHLLPGQALPFPEGWLLSLSVAASVLALNAIFLAAFSGSTSHLHRFLIPHYVIALLGILTLLCVAQIIFSLREMPTADAD